jgi:hypothetical protein
MRAVIAQHITDLTRYTGNGLEHQFSDEATVSIIGRLEELLQIKEIGYAGYRVALDHERQQAQHEHHHDPAIPFELGESHVLQVFLYGLKPDPSDLQVNLWMNGGLGQALEGELAPRHEASFASRMSGVSDWTLIIETKTPLDLIVQSKKGAREDEERLKLEPGRHEVEVRPRFAERYAICLSPANDPYGAIEVKHSFLGEVGAVSGRFLWSKNKLWLPPTRTLPSFISLIVDCVTVPMSKAITEIWKTVDEVEVMTSLANVSQVQSALNELPNLRSKITVADKGFHENIGIALIGPNDDIPAGWTGKTSCLLFDDQAELGFKSRLEATLSRLEYDRELSGSALEGLWTAAEENCQPEGRSAAYGIAWSTSSHSEQKGRVSLLRTMATETEMVKADIRRYAAQPFNAHVFKGRKDVSQG